MTQSASRRMKRKNWRKIVFLVSMLILPVAQWLVFWLYVNIDSVLIAFQFARGGWTLSNFSKLFMELGEGGSILSESVINTFVFFGVNLLIIMPITEPVGLKSSGSKWDTSSPVATLSLSKNV